MYRGKGTRVKPAGRGVGDYALFAMTLLWVAGKTWLHTGEKNTVRIRKRSSMYQGEAAAVLWSVRSYSAKNDKLFHYDGNTSSFAMNVGGWIRRVKPVRMWVCSSISYRRDSSSNSTMPQIDDHRPEAVCQHVDVQYFEQYCMRVHKKDTISGWLVCAPNGGDCLGTWFYGERKNIMLPSLWQWEMINEFWLLLGSS